MEKQNFNATIVVNSTPAEALEKIADIGNWWAKDFTGKAAETNDTFTIRFGDTFVDFKITEAIPDTKIVWHVVDSYLPWLHDKTEWNNTDVLYEVSPEKNATKIHFTHVGLVPGIECYEQCERGWTRFVTVSLPKFINEGTGLPE